MLAVAVAELVGVAVGGEAAATMVEVVEPGIVTMVHLGVEEAALR